MDCVCRHYKKWRLYAPEGTVHLQIENINMKSYYVTYELMKHSYILHNYAYKLDCKFYWYFIDVKLHEIIKHDENA